MIKRALRLLSLTVVGFSIAVTAIAQNQKSDSAVSTQEVQSASTAYGQCVVAAARRYASTHELPADIVSAAFA
jgi:hypothetical protein